MNPKVLIMAGGTGGHIFPAMSVARNLAAKGMTVHWLGAEKGMETQLVDNNEFKLHLLSVSALKGGGIGRKLKFPYYLLISLIQVWSIFKTFKPDMVVGFGGYASGPGGIVAKIANVPLVLHEQNAVAGLTNKYLSFFASKVIQAFPNTFDEKRKPVTMGNPVRNELVLLRTSENIAVELNNVLVLGGSLGAQRLNEMVPQAFAKIPGTKRPQIWHQAGKGKSEDTKKIYEALNVSAKVDSFITDMAEAYSWADIVICRSGASTVSELAAIGKAALFMPYPWHKDRQQFINADYLVSANAAKIISQDDQGVEELSSTIVSLLSDPKKLTTMTANARQKGLPDSVDRIGELIEQFLSKRGLHHD